MVILYSPEVCSFESTHAHMEGELAKVTSVLRPYALHNRLVQLAAADAGSRVESGIAAREVVAGRS